MNATRTPYLFCLLICGILALLHTVSHSYSARAQSGSRPSGTARAKGVIGLFDLEYHDGTKLARGRADKYERLPTLTAGSVISRDFVVYNDATPGTKVQVRVLPILHTSRTASRKLPPVVRALTVPNGGKTALRLHLSIPKVATNTGLEFVLTVSKQNRERFRDSLLFVAVPNGKGGTTVTYEGRDDKTRGDWLGVYGKQAFLIPVQGGRSAFQMPEITVQRGSGYEASGAENPFAENQLAVQHQLVIFERAETTDDPRIALRGPGQKERSPVAFVTPGSPLLIRVDTTDGKPHRLRLYLLDYKREGRITEIALYDLQGHRLDTRTVANYGEGAYLNYRFTGSVIARLILKKQADPTLSGVFVDAAD
jgi:hypothetical protein